MSQKTFYSLLLGITLAVFAWSGIGPHDRFTWVLEVIPVVIVLGLIVPTHSRFRFSRLAYALMCVHAIILMVGGHYTYALVPAGDWARELFDFQRNHYDRLGHLAQGFIPAIVTREMLLRLTPLERGGWLFTLVTSVCLAFSAFYELIEWWVAVWSGTAAEAFLGTQGDVWDTQSDMMMALIGAMLAQLMLARLHDKSMRAVSAGGK